MSVATGATAAEGPSFWRRRAWLVAAFAPALGCAPSPSTVPLGSGPLAVAEEARAAELASSSRAPRASSRTARASAQKDAAAEASAQAASGAGEAGEAATEDEVDGAAVPAAGEPSFEGLFAGDDVAVFRLTGFPEREQRDDQAKIRIEKASAGNVSITLINSEDGSDLCELLARVEGNAALIESAQPCFSDGSEGSLEAELTSGRAVLDGDRLTMVAEGTLSVALPDQELEGELSYSFEGERQ